MLVFSTLSFENPPGLNVHCGFDCLSFLSYNARMMNEEHKPTISISYRLSWLLSRIPSEASLVDVGTDHALLPIAAVQMGRIHTAIASDVAVGPVERASKQISQAGLTDLIDVRLGDGLSTVQPGEVDTVVIAGMGGSTITEILMQSPSVVEHTRMLLLQPMNAYSKLRQWLYQHHFFLQDESILKEDGRFYQCIQAIRNEYAFDVAYQLFPDEWDKRMAYQYGPLNLQRPTIDVEQYLQVEIQKYQNILQQMPHPNYNISYLPRFETDKRRQELLGDIEWIKNWQAKLSSERGG
ncbi:tRNA (adenine22-N1)-methyltransferase [Alicyclobacillus tolerans]|uniref:tRNA (Adenine22-N1)-methyltransferase n=2 Tax=Alicyclobacillus tolerans TaxID=90970 RepID=A0A1M6JVE6_9BACL|nr:tRNA (adenine22-N1)-methyltransferase [Alicyclobacillus montanus]